MNFIAGPRTEIATPPPAEPPVVAPDPIAPAPIPLMSVPLEPEPFMVRLTNSFKRWWSVS